VLPEVSGTEKNEIADAIHHERVIELAQQELDWHSLK